MTGDAESYTPSRYIEASKKNMKKKQWKGMLPAYKGCNELEIIINERIDGGISEYISEFHWGYVELTGGKITNYKCKDFIFGTIDAEEFYAYRDTLPDLSERN
jgi:hypothetical protein